MTIVVSGALRYVPRQHDHRHDRVTARSFHVLNVFGRVAVADLRYIRNLQKNNQSLSALSVNNFQLLVEVPVPPQRTTLSPLSVITAAFCG